MEGGSGARADVDVLLPDALIPGVLLPGRLQGGDLEQYIKDQSGTLLSEESLMRCFVQLCLALHHSHSKVRPASSLPASIYGGTRLADHAESGRIDAAAPGLAALPDLSQTSNRPFSLIPESISGKASCTKHTYIKPSNLMT